MKSLPSPSLGASLPFTRPPRQHLTLPQSAPWGRLKRYLRLQRQIRQQGSGALRNLHKVTRASRWQNEDSEPDPELTSDSPYPTDRYHAPPISGHRQRRRLQERSPPCIKRRVLVSSSTLISPCPPLATYYSRASTGLRSPDLSV